MLKYWKDLRFLPRPVWLVAGSQLVNRAGSMVLSFLVLYLTRDRGFSAEQAGFIIFLYGAGAIVSGPLSGRLADKWGSVPLMRASLFLSGAMLFVYPFAKGRIAIAAVTIVLAMLTEAFRPAAMSFSAPSATRGSSPPRLKPSRHSSSCRQPRGGRLRRSRSGLSHARCARGGVAAFRNRVVAAPRA